MARRAARYKYNECGTDGRVCYVGIYSRLSVDNGDRKAESVENQIDIINQFIRDNNSDPDRETEMMVYDTYIDRGISGTSFERSGFERLMQDIRERRVNCIIVKDLSRFGRDYLEAGNLIEKVLPFLNCRFIAVADRFDSGAANANDNRLTMNIKNLVNEMYAKDISKRVAAARRLSAERGEFTGGLAPYGYETVRIEGLRKLQVKEDCAGIVRNIFALYAEGNTVSAIIKRLHSDRVHRISDYRRYGHVHCRPGEKLYYWSEGSVIGILRNTVYMGGLRHTQEAVVSEELFEKVRRLRTAAGKKTVTEDSVKATENIYRNIIHCGCCGKIMHAACYRSRVNADRHYSYYCRGAYLPADGGCERSCIREEQLTGIVSEELRRTLNEQMGKEETAELIMTEYYRRIADCAPEEKRIAGECEYMKKQAGIMYGKYKDGVITKEEYNVFRQGKKEQEARAGKRMEEIRERIKRAESRTEAESSFLRPLFRENGDKCVKLNIRLAEALIEKICIFPGGVIDITYSFGDRRGVLKGEENSGILPSLR